MKQLSGEDLISFIQLLSVLERLKHQDEVGAITISDIEFEMCELLGVKRSELSDSDFEQIISDLKYLKNISMRELKLLTEVN